MAQASLDPRQSLSLTHSPLSSAIHPFSVPPFLINPLDASSTPIENKSLLKLMRLYLLSPVFHPKQNLSVSAFKIDQATRTLNLTFESGLFLFLKLLTMVELRFYSASLVPFPSAIEARATIFHLPSGFLMNFLNNLRSST